MVSISAKAWLGQFLLLFLINFNQSYAINSSTNIQLRKSVEFSYCGANLFLDLIRGNASRSTTEEFLSAYKDVMNFGLPTLIITPIFRNFPGYAACLLFGLLFAILMPLIGIFFCCIRCCGRCGGRVTQMDNKADPCRRVCYTSTLAIITTIQLAAIVLAFINYQLYYEAILSNNVSVGAVPQLSRGIHQFQHGVTDIVDAAKNLSSANLEIQKQKFDTVFDAGLIDFQKNFLDTSSAAVVVMEMNALQIAVSKFGADSLEVIELRDFLSSLERMENELPFQKSTISDILNTECKVDQLSACRELRSTTDNDLKVTYTVEEFQSTEINRFFDVLELSQQKIKNLDKLNITLLRMKEDIKKVIQPLLDDAWKNLSNDRKTREDLVLWVETIGKRAEFLLKNANERLTHYHASDPPRIQSGLAEHVLYGGIAFLCLPVLIIFVVYMGLSFGACGDRPYDEAGVCNRGVGANLLMSGVVFIFLLSSLLMLVCTALFLAGGLMQTEVCRYITGRYPDGPAVLDDILVTFAEATAPPAGEAIDYHKFPEQAVAKTRPFTVILDRCANDSLVDSVGDEIVGMLISNKSISQFLENLLTTFNGLDLISPLRETTSETLSTLDGLSNLQDFNFSRAILKTYGSLTAVPDFEAYVTQLSNLKIASLQDQIDGLRESVGMLSLRLEVIRKIYQELESIHIHYSTLKSAVKDFSLELEETVPKSIRNQIDSMRPLFIRELRLAVIASWRDISCTNLHDASKMAVNAVCGTFLNPLNGLWFGLGVCLVLFIPSLIFSVKLINLYRKTEKYSPDYEEPDYISYQGFYMTPASGEVQGPRKPRPRKGNKYEAGYTQLQPVA